MRTMIPSVLVLVLWGTAPSLAQLPPEIMADRYLVEAETLIAGKDYGKAIELMDKIVALQKEHHFTLPDVFHFKYAELALSAGSVRAAIDSVNKYLAAAGREGEFYREALELLVQAEQEEARLQRERAEFEAQRKQEEAEQRRAEARQREQDEQVQRQIEAAARPLPRDALRSGGLGPEMVKIASGRFQYYTRQESGKSLWMVEFERPFAISKYEVTRGAFETFVRKTRYRTETERVRKYYCSSRRRFDKSLYWFKWNRPGFEQTDAHPVVCVSIRDAMAYAEWLSQETGKTYRIPSAAEWRYAARAGSRESMWYIDGAHMRYQNCGRANLDEDEDNDCTDGVRFTTEVGTFPPNGIGVHDMIGNVAEQVLACGHVSPDDYLRLALDGSPEEPDSCNTQRGRVAMGSSYYHAGLNATLATYYSWSGQRLDNARATANEGFRVVRDLPDQAESR